VKGLKLFVAACFLAPLACARPTSELPDIRTVPRDLVVPPVSGGNPAPGKRVVQTAPEYAGTAVHHTLYLPRDWEPGKRFPVLVEYPGNGPYSNDYGDLSSGEVEGCVMGYGLSGGAGFIWLALPFVDSETQSNQTWWWGDVEATVRYAKRAVRRVVDEFGGDPSAVVLAGFSRGAIAVNYIGLHDDEIADLWAGFMPYSHYDGVREWNYPGSGRSDALARLKRLRGRPSFITHERSINETRDYLAQTEVQAPFALRAVPFRNHNAAWTLRDIPLRREARQWLAQVVASAEANR